jgi:hypothetical protein
MRIARTGTSYLRILGFSCWALTTCSAEPIAESSVQSLADAYCEMARSCCAQAGHPTKPLANCESEALQMIEALQPIVAGKAEPLEPAFSQCVDALREGGERCAVTSPSLRAACALVTRGLVPEGGACSQWRECRPASTKVACVKTLTPGAGASATGICKPLVRARDGDACAGDGGEHWGGTTYTAEDPTLALAYCDFRDQLYCKGRKTCAPLLSEGDDCQDGQCPVGQHCNVTCQLDLSEGDDCTQGGQCEIGLACVDGHCRQRPFDASGTCAGDLN